jgi:hypothetical protein
MVSPKLMKAIDQNAEPYPEEDPSNPSISADEIMQAAVPEEDPSNPSISADEIMQQASAPTRDYDAEAQAELTAARGQGDQARLASVLSRGISGLSSAVTGQRPDYSTAEALDVEANRGVAELQQNKAFKQASESARLAREKRDPNSEYNRGFVAQVEQVFPTFMKGLSPQAKANMTEESLSKIAPWITEGLRTGAAQQKASEDRTMREEDRAFRADESAKDRQSRLEAAKLRSAGRGGGDELSNSEAYRLKSLSDKLLPLSEMDLMVKNLEAQLPNLEKIGLKDKAASLIPGEIGSYAMSDKALALDTTVRELKELILRARSGGVITNNEAATYSRIVGSGIVSDPRVLQNTVTRLKAQIEAKRNTIRKGSTERVKSVFDSAEGGSAPKEASGTTKIKSLESQKTRDVENKYVEELLSRKKPDGTPMYERVQ